MGRASLIVEASDGSSRYIYRGFRFVITRGGLMWWCHNGISIPQEISYPGPAFCRGMTLAINGGMGFASLSRRGILRKIRRAVDRCIAKSLRDGALNGTQPDARVVVDA